MRCEEEHPTRFQQALHPRMGQQLQPPPSRAPAGHHQGRHRHKATALLHKLDEVRRARWTEVVESVDFTHSSRKAWQTINKLTGRSTTHSRCPVTANAIASQLLNNGRFPDADRDFARWTSREVTSLSRAATADANMSSDFTVEELEAAIKKLKSGKAPGRYNIHPEFVIHQSAKTTAWLYMFVPRVVFPKIQATEDLAPCYRRGAPKTK